MNFCPAILPARWLGVAAFVIAAMTAGAQPTIQFARPVDPNVSNTIANTFGPASKSRNLPAAFNAPSSLFGDNTPTVDFDVLPGSPNQGAVSPATAAQWKKFLAGKNNWMLETPEEVLGIQTPEKILGLTDPNEDLKLSPEERFLQRQDRLDATSATNGYHQPYASFWRGDTAGDAFQPATAGPRFDQTLNNSIPGAKNFNRLFNPNPNPPSAVVQPADAGWAYPFGTPAPTPKATPEQLAGMEVFRQLLNSSEPEKAPDPSAFSFRPAVTPAATPDPNLQVLPAYNAVGQTFTPLESGIGKPMGLTPLPGLTGPRPLSAKKAAPLAQTPPWLSDSPQGFAPPQRQF